MTLYRKIRNRLIADKAFYFIFIPISFFLFVLAFLLLLYPQAAIHGVGDGIDTCLEAVIPALFPFLVISGIAYDFGVFDYISSKFEKLMMFLFSLPSVAFPIIAMSMLGGFPVGATLIAKAFDSCRLSRQQAQRMLMFCVNPGPAFVVSAVGYSVIGSVQAGWIIYAATTASSLAIGILSRFLAENDEFIPFESKNKHQNTMSDILSETISNSTKNMMNICVWVVIFSCLGKLFEMLPVSTGSLAFFRMISEVTNGAMTASEHFPLPVVAAVISFSGLCVHFQIMPCLIKVRLKYKYFLSVRILSAAISCVFTLLLVELFPQYSQVISMGTKPQSTSMRTSPLICVCLMLMCGLFIVGDNYILNRKAVKSSFKGRQMR